MNVLLSSIPIWESKSWKTISLGELCLLHYLNFIIKENKLIMRDFRIEIPGLEVFDRGVKQT